MALATLKSRILLSTVYIAREGDTHSTSLSVARASKPPYGDAAWLDIGVVKDCEFASEDINPQEIRAPAGGQLVVYDEIKAGTRGTIKFTCSELNYLHLQHVFESAKLASTDAQLNPFEGTTKRAWIKFMASDQDVAAGGTPTLVGDCWARLKVTGPLRLGGGEMSELPFEALVLHSIYNTLSF